MHDQKTILKEKILHGDAVLPFAYYRTVVFKNMENILYLHWHDEFEIIYIEEGAARFTIENRHYDVYQGQALFIHSNYLHSATSLNSMNCTFSALVFRFDFISGSSGSHLYQKFFQPVIQRTMTFIEHLIHPNQIQLIESLLPYVKKEIMEEELIIKSKLMELWYTLYQSPIKLNTAQEDLHYLHIKRLKPVFDYIHTHYMEDLTLRDLACIIPISESQFCRTFKEVMGVSPFNYILNYRIMTSCSLLSETEKKIAEIANLVGFNNISYYNREFKSIVGCTPSEYRKK